MASLRVNYKSIAALVQAYSSDISEGGLFLPTRELLPIGAVVELKIKLPDDGPELRAIARVAHVLDEGEAKANGRKAGMGMEFLERDDVPVSDQVAEFLFKRDGELSGVAADDGAKGRILVVDDSDFHREQTASAIRMAGHEVLTAKDGFEGLKTAVRQRLDLIVSDVKMPTMDGWHLLRMIRNRSSLAAIPVIFLTTLNSDEERLLGYKLGVDDFIGKGFTEQELILRVQRVLERARAQHGAAKEKALKGDLTHVSLASLLSLLDMERRTGHLLLIRQKEIANLLLRNGAVVSIDAGESYRDKTPLERFFYVLDWTEGQFELTAAEVTVEDTVGLPTSHIILEHARQKDEESQQ